VQNAVCAPLAVLPTQLAAQCASLARWVTSGTSAEHSIAYPVLLAALPLCWAQRHATCALLAESRPASVRAVVSVALRASTRAHREALNASLACLAISPRSQEQPTVQHVLVVSTILPLHRPVASNVCLASTSPSLVLLSVLLARRGALLDSLERPNAAYVLPASLQIPPLLRAAQAVHLAFSTLKLEQHSALPAALEALQIRAPQRSAPSVHPVRSHLIRQCGLVTSVHLVATSRDMVVPLAPPVHQASSPKQLDLQSVPAVQRAASRPARALQNVLLVYLATLTSSPTPLKSALHV
jgi:hypothetical protein